MSHYFPMVSASPPPFDDGNDEDEFGDFSSGLQDEYNISNTNGGTTTNTTNNNNSSSPFNSSFSCLQLKQIDEDQIITEKKIDDQQVNVTNGGDDYGDFQDIHRLSDGEIELPVTVESQKVEHKNCLATWNAHDDQEQADKQEKEDGCVVVHNDSSHNVELNSVENERNRSAEWVVDDEFQWQNDEEEDEEVGVILQKSFVSESVRCTEVVKDEAKDGDNCCGVSREEFNFETVIEGEEEATSLEDKNLNEEEEIDDFADFQTVDVKPEGDFNDFQAFSLADRTVDEDEEESNFATFDNFNTCPQSQTFQQTFSDEEDEFGNFESTFQPSSFDHLLSSALCSIFVNPDTKSEPPELIELDAALKMKNSKTSCDCVWEKLNDIDNTQALTYHWSGSRTNKLLIHSLHLNSHNFLPGVSSIPLFAANLGAGPLEPTKAPLKSVEEGLNSLNIDLIPPPTSSTTENIVPPASFDWGSSGLINPLDDSTSALLDLDFFLTNDYISSSASKMVTSLETEFLGNEPVSKSAAYPETKTFSPLVDKILSEAKGGTGGRVRRNISEEAKRILNSLQDLSFMQAKVLMFPIRDGAGYDS